MGVLRSVPVGAAHGKVADELKEATMFCLVSQAPDLSQAHRVGDLAPPRVRRAAIVLTFRSRITRRSLPLDGPR